ncbi:MAG: hypothetical protein LBE09_01495 [Christensenellaceae bacterium]|jgi:hypothetical protein|nr:hypothetical protein [Christensenellaceae bacterium]
MHYYSDYIDVSTNYESVIDFQLDKAHPELWKSYIIQDDMKKTLEVICQTMLWEDNDKRRSFWIHGAYGTGKTYAAIALKHLFEDTIKNVDDFLNRPGLSSLKSRFMKIRQDGEFLVVWKSGTTDIKSGTKLMMEMEVQIKEKLKEKFGDNAYYGRNSLIDAAKDAIQDKSINWEYLFLDSRYDIDQSYKSLEEFKEAVLKGNNQAIDKVRQVCDDNSRAMFTSAVERFQDWIKDIIDGNNLSKTGIVFIWDEFSHFLRDCGDDNVLQRLSEFCKSEDTSGEKKTYAPFFMCLIVHRDPTWVATLGDETYKRILHRYHELRYHITENAAYDLIEQSIVIRPGMEKEWEEKRKNLCQPIFAHTHEFDNLDQNINMRQRLLRLCPIHPMTILMLATVAEHFGASQRTLFRFIKDKTAHKNEGAGFAEFIKNNNPDKWQWLTPDYLWDYFFMGDSDRHNFSEEAGKAILHYQNKGESISDDEAMHVFKAALLLISVMSGSNVSNFYSRQSKSKSKITDTRSSLHKCFRGQLDDDIINKYLDSFKDTKLLSLGESHNGDIRLELPYTSSVDVFDQRLKKTRSTYTRYSLFSKKGLFSKPIETELWDSARASAGRIYIAVCASDKKSRDERLGEVINELENHPHKIGLLVIVISEARDYAEMQEESKSYIKGDKTGRLVGVVLKEPCDGKMLGDWYKKTTHMEICREESRTADADKYRGDADILLSNWVRQATQALMTVDYDKIHNPGIFGKSELMNLIEKNVLYKVFTLAPEQIVTTNTAYRKCTSDAVLCALTRNKNTSSQVKNIINKLDEIGAWAVNDIDEFNDLEEKNSEIIKGLAQCIKSEISNNTKISLGLLWAKLQQKPYGYYNTMTAGCFIGLVMRFFVDSKYSWHDGINAQPPTAENLASMINRMLEGKAEKDTISSGSGTWQKFRPFLTGLFNLDLKQVVTDSEARKHIKGFMMSTGAPLWSLKYMSSEKFSTEEEYKKIAGKIADLLCSFVYEVGDQETIMDDIINLFNRRGPLRKLMGDNLANKELMTEAFKNFIIESKPEIKEFYDLLNLSYKDIYDMLRGYLQDSISTWTQAQAIEKLSDLERELKVIATIKTAINANIKTYNAAQQALDNVFENMKIPGTIIEEIPVDWIETLKIFRTISKTPLKDISKTLDIFELLARDAKKVWDHLVQPRLILKELLAHREIEVTDEEFDSIYNKLKSVPYETPNSIFNADLEKLLAEVQYVRYRGKIQNIWKESTNTDSVREWCNEKNVPIAWLDKLNIDAIRTIKTLQDGVLVKMADILQALSYLQENDLSILQDANYIGDRFFAHIGENYRTAFSARKDDIITKLKTSIKLSSDVYSWENKTPEIKEILDNHLRKEYQEKVKKYVMNEMSDKNLRAAVVELLQANPEMYSYFLN